MNDSLNLIKKKVILILIFIYTCLPNVLCLFQCVSVNRRVQEDKEGAANGVPSERKRVLLDVASTANVALPSLTVVYDYVLYKRSYYCH